ncbi:unnamed protein product [Auanema sp. JU1783]|nr:unnamed protein product [Auanema sp. JU1783]
MFSKYFLLFLAHVINVNLQNIKCSNKEFLCEASSRCIPLSWLCDGSRDCSDSADENHEHCDIRPANSSCFGNQPECLYGGIKRCILHEWLCDGHKDCDNGDDEQGCEIIEKVLDRIQCGVAEFTCASGSCVPLAFACNGAADCMDGSDELDCKKKSQRIIEPGDQIVTSLRVNESTQVFRNVSNTNSSLDDTDLTMKPKFASSSSESDEMEHETTVASKPTIAMPEVPNDISESSRNDKVEHKPLPLTSFVYTFTSTTVKMVPTTTTSPVHTQTTTPFLNPIFSTRNIMFDLFPWLTTKASSVPTTSVPTSATSPQTSTQYSSSSYTSSQPTITTSSYLLETPKTTPPTSSLIEENNSVYIQKAKVFKVHHAPKVSSVSEVAADENIGSSNKITRSDGFGNVSDATDYKKPLREIARPVRFVKGLQKPNK